MSSSSSLQHCSHCPYSTDKNSNFKRHYQTMHQPLDPPLHCCDTSFRTKGEYRAHVRSTHSAGHRCPAPHCGKLFSRRALLERHSAVHSGNKPYRCSRCGYGSANKANVARHLSTHAPQGRPYLSHSIEAILQRRGGRMRRGQGETVSSHLPSRKEYEGLAAVQLEQYVSSCSSFDWVSDCSEKEARSNSTPFLPEEKEAMIEYIPKKLRLSKKWVPSIQQLKQ